MFGDLAQNSPSVHYSYMDQFDIYEYPLRTLKLPQEDSRWAVSLPRPGHQVNFMVNDPWLDEQVVWVRHNRAASSNGGRDGSQSMAIPARRRFL